ncbi:MAG: NADAR family protein [Bacteroidales bacterium]|nr:NADAR family protein [Bacteroidales bacterium]
MKIEDTLTHNDYLFFYGSIFSQWFPCTFTIDKITYSSAEQYMMAEKALLFADLKTRDAILTTICPSYAKELGRMVKNYDEDIWNRHKINIVLQGNLAKFSQNPKLLQQLLSVKELFVEASPHDKIWGIGLSIDNPQIYEKSNWLGENLLGLILKQTQHILNKKVQNEN